MKKKILIKIAILASMIPLSSCNLFIFGEETAVSPIETFDNTYNCIAFALYNYYGYEGQHFTNKWLGMLDALNDHGITASNYMENDDAKSFVIDETNSDLPKRSDGGKNVLMINNLTWDASQQFTKPLAKNHPMAIISTCNGVEFAGSPILSSGMGISNATMGGFSTLYEEAFENGSLRYVCAKYSTHFLPIFAACVDACDHGKAMKNSDGTALRISIENWAIQTLDEFREMSKCDSIDKDHPTLRKINIDKFFDESNVDYGSEKLVNWIQSQKKDEIKAIYAENAENKTQDEANFRKGKKLKCGIIAPSSINDQVQKYIDYMKGYCGEAYNVEFLNGSVTSSNPQSTVATQLINQGCDFIISVQDDTDRNTAAQRCNDAGVYFAIAGSCQSTIDYEMIKDLPYYVGSLGTSPEEERRAAKEMTEYYLQCMIHKDQGDLVEWQCQYKGLNYDDYKE